MEQITKGWNLLHTTFRESYICRLCKWLQKNRASFNNRPRIKQTVVPNPNTTNSCRNGVLGDAQVKKRIIPESEYTYCPTIKCVKRIMSKFTVLIKQ